MAWTAGADVSTGDLITAAQWNNYLGATGSLEYLYDNRWKWFPVTGGTNGVSNTGPIPLVALTALNDEAWISFHVPPDFTSITTAVVVVCPYYTDAAANWDISSQYAAEGALLNEHTESDTATTYNVTANQKYLLNISGILTGVAAGDSGGVEVKLGNADDDVQVLGMFFHYQ